MRLDTLLSEILWASKVQSAQRAHGLRNPLRKNRAGANSLLSSQEQQDAQEKVKELLDRSGGHKQARDTAMHE